MKKNSSDNDKKNIDQVIKILSQATPKITKEMLAEESDDIHEIETELWRDGAQRLEKIELLKKLRLTNKDLSNNIEFRRILTFRLLAVTKVWLFFIAIIIILQGLYGTIFPWFGHYLFKFHLSSNVMIAVLTSTTVTVVGLFLVVTRHIFNRGQ